MSIQFYVSDKIINNSDNFRFKCLSCSKISAILFVLYFRFYILHLILSKKCEKISCSLLYLALVTLCIIGPFLCYHLLYLIIYLLRTVLSSCRAYSWGEVKILLFTSYSGLNCLITIIFAALATLYPGFFNPQGQGILT